MDNFLNHIEKLKNIYNSVLNINSALVKRAPYRYKLLTDREVAYNAFKKELDYVAFVGSSCLDDDLLEKETNRKKRDEDFITSVRMFSSK